jgi:chromosome segregation ATPase
MQQEAGKALHTYAILERDFTEKFEAATGDALERADALEEALNAMRTERIALLAELEAAEDNLKAREDELAEQALAFQALHEERREEAEALKDAKQEARSARGQLAALQAVNRELESRLAQTLETADRLRSRVDSLESALRASVQHNAEQEDVLLRWQELAETTQEEAGMLRSKLTALELELVAREGELVSLRDRAERSGADSKAEGPAHSSEHDAQATAEDRRSEEGKALDAALAGLQQQQEQILWYKTSLHAAENQLRAAQQGTLKLEQQVAEAEEAATAAAALAEKWKERLGHVSDLLYESEKKVKAFEDGEVPSRAAVRRQLEEREARVKPLVSNQRRLEDELATAARQLKELQEQLEARNRSLAEMRVEIEQRQRDAENIRAQARLRIRQLRQELADARKR